MHLSRRRPISSAHFLSLMLASGGDWRISVPHGGNTNIYGASPFPRSTLGYASSTANDISMDAFLHLQTMVAGWPAGGLIDPAFYADALESLRHRIRAAWGLGGTTQIVFAPSGTDLEFAALGLVASHSGQPVMNILLGPDEVGSGCILAGAGRHFAQETALCGQTPKGHHVSGLEDTGLASVPVRDEAGQPLSSTEVARAIDRIARQTRASGRHVLVHVVHGSKTGLVLPSLEAIDALRACHGGGVSFVVDACQARIDAPQIRAYLDRGCLVLLTGSKFMGGPPFSGMALVPEEIRPARMLAQGLATLFRRAEWPMGWRSCDILPDGANPGLLLRLESAIFELERFLLLCEPARQRVIDAFAAASRMLAARLGARLVTPALSGPGLHLATLATLDLSGMPACPDFAVAQRWHRILAARGIRLGQPVKCVQRADGAWAGTLRISLSMPLIASLAELAAAQLEPRFSRDMVQIAQVLEAAQRPVVA